MDGREREGLQEQSGVLVAVPRTVVHGASRLLIVVQSEVWVRPVHLVVPRDVARNFDVVRILSGGRPQGVVGSGGVPASLFAGDAQSVGLVAGSERCFKIDLDYSLQLKMWPIGPGKDVGVEVENLCAYACQFAGAFYGELIE